MPRNGFGVPGSLNEPATGEASAAAGNSDRFRLKATQAGILGNSTQNVSQNRSSTAMAITAINMTNPIATKENASRVVTGCSPKPLP